MHAAHPRSIDAAELRRGMLVLDGTCPHTRLHVHSMCSPTGRLALIEGDGAPLRKIFSLAVISGCIPVPTSNKEAIRPLALILPVVGEVMRDINFNSVDFPAPFLPTMPSTSPFFT